MPKGSDRTYGQEVEGNMAAYQRTRSFFLKIQVDMQSTFADETARVGADGHRHAAPRRYPVHSKREGTLAAFQG